MKKVLLTALFTVLLLSTYKQASAYGVEIGVAGISKTLNPETTYNWTTCNVNLREKASTDSKIYETLSKNTKVQKLNESKGWTKVKYNDITGYIKSDYLAEQELSLLELTSVSIQSNRWGVELTDDEIELLAKITWVEARGESDEGQQAVVEVVFNRMVHWYFSGSLYDVLSQKGQFTSWKKVKTAEPTEKEYQNIMIVLSGNTNITIDNTVYFGTKARNKKVTNHIGGHYFCEYEHKKVVNDTK